MSERVDELKIKKAKRYERICSAMFKVIVPKPQVLLNFTASNWFSSRSNWNLIQSVLSFIPNSFPVLAGGKVNPQHNAARIMFQGEVSVLSVMSSALYYIILYWIRLIYLSTTVGKKEQVRWTDIICKAGRRNDRTWKKQWWQKKITSCKLTIKDKENNLRMH